MSTAHAMIDTHISERRAAPGAHIVRNFLLQKLRRRPFRVFEAKTEYLFPAVDAVGGFVSPLRRHW